MENIKERIESLRKEMRNAGVAAYVIPSQDPHLSEYTPEHWQARSWFSGFSGSAGTLVVTMDESGLWTDGRYFIQAERELSGSDIKLFRMGVSGVPGVGEYLCGKLKPGESAGFDARMFPAARLRIMRGMFSGKGIGTVPCDLVTPLWKDRPPMPHTEVYVHGARYAGYTCAEKINQVRAMLAKHGADGQIYTRLDCTAWLMDIRADDIAYTPLAVAWSAVLPDGAHLFIDTSRVKPEAMHCLKENGVTVHEYGEFEDFLKSYDKEVRLLVDMTSTNGQTVEILKGNASFSIRGGADIVTSLKGVKNSTEIENIKKAHVLDGCALAAFKSSFEEKMAAGEKMTEWDVCVLLSECRARLPENKGESFATIAAYGANAAMMHYSPKPGACSTIENKGLLLIDSGGQYFEGTTDITRTFAMGPLSRGEMEDYTYVLKANIALARAVFMEGETGGNLDILCRKELWEHGIDYRCGTGHGVGMFSSVHEGPQNISPKNRTVFKAGMTVTDEPGAYIEGKYGIRTENLLLVTEAFTNEYGRFYKFEPLTCFPIDLQPVLTGLLSKGEAEWLNGYHSWVYKTLSPYLSGKALSWLRKNTQPVKLK
jgi:Xaa-Pro aminopeptidase